MTDLMLPSEGFYDCGAEELAPRLIGCTLRRHLQGGPVAGIIVETEAYTSDDPASHSYRGRTNRNGPMFMGGGRIYVYMIYGMHHCFNVTAGPAGSGEAVLVRAMKPSEGLELMRMNSPGLPDGRLCRGPGLLCRSLGLGLELSGQPLGGDVTILMPGGPGDPPVASGKRVGIKRGRERRWRFVMKGSRWLSRPV